MTDAQFKLTVLHALYDKAKLGKCFIDGWSICCLPVKRRKDFIPKKVAMIDIFIKQALVQIDGTSRMSVNP